MPKTDDFADYRIGKISFCEHVYIGLPYEGMKCHVCGYFFMGMRRPTIICPICLFPARYLSSEVMSHFEDDGQPDGGFESVTDERKCEVCGKDISDRRPQIKTCSPKCRKALSRMKR